MSKKELIIDLCKQLTNNLSYWYKKPHRVELVTGMSNPKHNPCVIKILFDGECIFKETHSPEGNKSQEEIEEVLLDRLIMLMFGFAVTESKIHLDKIKQRNNE